MKVRKIIVFGILLVFLIIIILPQVWSASPNVINQKLFTDDGRNRTNSWLNLSYTFNDTAGDNETGFETTWFINNTAQVSLNNFKKISPGNTTKGQVWIVSVRVNDTANEWSAWVNTSSLTILNTPPTTPTNFSPISGTWGGTRQLIPVNCSGSTDADEDILNYEIQRWNGTTGILVKSWSGQENSTWNISTQNTTLNFAIRCHTSDGVVFSPNYFTTPFNISIDNSPPYWSNVQKNQTLIFQNTYINFTANWAENTTLSGFIFSINQSGIWINSSYTTFTGANNISSNITRITVNPGTNVSWYFWANDTLGNANRTTLQSFIVITTNTIPVVSNVLIIPDDNWQNLTTANLTASWSFTDADNNSQILNETQWFKNNIRLTPLDNLTYLSYAFTSANETWILGVRAFDGINWSSWVNSSSFLILGEVSPQTPAGGSGGGQYTNLSNLTGEIKELEEGKIGFPSVLVEFFQKIWIELKNKPMQYLFLIMIIFILMYLFYNIKGRKK